MSGVRTGRAGAAGTARCTPRTEGKPFFVGDHAPFTEAGAGRAGAPGVKDVIARRIERLGDATASCSPQRRSPGASRPDVLEALARARRPGCEALHRSGARAKMVREEPDPPDATASSMRASARAYEGRSAAGERRLHAAGPRRMAIE